MQEILPVLPQMGTVYQNIVSETFVCTIEVIYEAMQKVGKQGMRLRLFCGELIGSADEIITKDQNRLDKLIAQAKDIASAVNTRSALTTESTVKANQQILQDTATKLDDYLEKSAIASLEKQLNPVKDAYINSDKVCLEGTRVQIQEKISQWILNPKNDGPQIFLLCGAAGTGKSAISHAIGKKFKEMNYLGAFFAFNRTFATERTPVRAVQTIACDLAKQIPKLGKALIKILEQDSDILRDPSLKEQWKKLIWKPAQSMNESRPVVIIFDALDESGEQGGNSPRGQLISLLLDTKQNLPKNFYIFMTSRLEWDVGKHLELQSDHLITEHMDDLEDTKGDISRYVIDHITKANMISEINETQCRQLAEKAEGYFQWAATVCTEICNYEMGPEPQELFQQFMRLAPKPGEEYPLDPTYTLILQQNVKEKAIRVYKKVMSQVLASLEPLSQQSLQRLQSACYKQRPKENAKIEDNEEPQVKSVLKFLGSLFTGVHDSNIPVRPVHTSVRDFLLDSQRSGKYAIDVLQGHTTMTLGTIGLMIEELHFNMCELESSDVLNSEVKDLKNRINQNITLELRYACCHWDLHLSTIQPPATENKMVHALKFLLEKFICSKLSLFWMEVLSILDRVGVISRSISKMTKWVETMGKILKFEEELKMVGEEIRSFLFVFGKVLSESTPHIYVSALPFIPKHSKLQETYVSQFTNLLKVCHGHRINWPHLQAVLQKDTGIIRSVAFSPDGKRIVSGSFDCSVRIWDAETGEPQGQPLQGHTREVNSVAFSPDGKRIVSGSWDDSVRIWNAEAGEPQEQSLQGHTREINSVPFSPDGKRIVSGYWDDPVQILNAGTGESPKQSLQEHTSLVDSIAFSPGQRIHHSHVHAENIEVAGIDEVLLPEYSSAHQTQITSIFHSRSSSSLSFCPWHPGHNYPHPTLQTPTLLVNGWLQNSNSSLFLWIPPEYRSSLMLPPMQILIAKASPASLNLKDFCHGNNWAKCCRY
ncbi:hypothetical protein GYMLUDRAFT_198501 [Collybiopsis luxurians FD-317 M1]|uniref:Nephrocystin 3-like N-terminal domain-containing protein n=1 Tax=Collybiopsis luxurians FD-317 M1 TaxID=944289 RepID=A0A0D0BEB0_9AGAR|nr:hypothetical protein GYMLUDRAFT_198501 [Collybiopsis luxurians FD-317 M1]